MTTQCRLRSKFFITLTSYCLTIEFLYRTTSTTYGFKNHMKLSTDANHFEKEVRNAEIGGNIDLPEGGFDALMQAIVCHDEIGWRKQARRLIVFSTDADFHYAGDGKLGGIVQPNSGTCNMKDGNYTHSLIEDYPSVAHINAKVKENAINLIFAVTKWVLNIYDELSGYIEGSYVSPLESESSNVAELIKEQYNVRNPNTNQQICETSILASI